MKYFLRALGYNPRKYRVRRHKLRHRLMNIFTMDAIEGQLDSLVRSVQK